MISYESCEDLALAVVFDTTTPQPLAQEEEEEELEDRSTVPKVPGQKWW